MPQLIQMALALVAVGLRREPGVDLLYTALRQVRVDDLGEKIVRLFHS